ncbi:hypothetical protein DFP78_10624 [Photobacterium lutimaris]|nr:hypothetical protein DFP78_10624 [Photobacterium lutimaris]
MSTPLNVTFPLHLEFQLTAHTLVELNSFNDLKKANILAT